jgi:hypothetical protein
MPDGAGSYYKEFFLLTYQKLIFLAGQENKCGGGVRQKLNISMGYFCYRTILPPAAFDPLDVTVGVEYQHKHIHHIHMGIYNGPLCPKR